MRDRELCQETHWCTVQIIVDLPGICQIQQTQRLPWRAENSVSLPVFAALPDQVLYLQVVYHYQEDDCPWTYLLLDCPGYARKLIAQHMWPLDNVPAGGFQCLVVPLPPNWRGALTFYGNSATLHRLMVSTSARVPGTMKSRMACSLFTPLPTQEMEQVKYDR
jgi:hypothetical protein